MMSDLHLNIPGYAESSHNSNPHGEALLTSRNSTSGSSSFINNYVVTKVCLIFCLHSDLKYLISHVYFISNFSFSLFECDIYNFIKFIFTESFVKNKNKQKTADIFSI